jgi:hypothetical protein
MAGQRGRQSEWSDTMAGQRMADENNIKTQTMQCGKNSTHQLLVKNIHDVVHHMYLGYKPGVRIT